MSSYTCLYLGQRNFSLEYEIEDLVILVYACLIRALNSIYIQASYIPIAEYVNS